MKSDRSSRDARSFFYCYFNWYEMKGADMTNLTYGYMHVSTKEQNGIRQMIAMREFGVEEKIFFGQAIRQRLQTSTISETHLEN